ncbi:hypothetical protein DFH09DRAFT_1491071, partial [Mycena vulgaris]
IVPGAIWYDKSGAVLSAHPDGICAEDKTFFSGRLRSFSRMTRGQGAGISVYSSVDLTNWYYRGRALSPIPGTAISVDLVGERPKVVFNKATQDWMLWLHSDNSNYGLLGQGGDTSPNVTGPYTFQGAFSSLGGTSQDFGLFQDVDGEAYALYSNGDADAANDNLITRMNANYTDVEEVVYTF